MLRSAAVFAFLMAAPVALLAQEVTGSSAVTAQYSDPETIERITLRLAGEGRETWDTVLEEGEPSLTWGSVASFAILLSETFDMQLTEAESELLAKRFAQRYRSSDEAGRETLAAGWGALLEEAAGGAEAKSRVKTKLGAMIQSAADAKVGWALAAREAMDRRGKTLQKSAGARPAWAGKGFDATMSVADLDASIEMLYFMWVAAGRNPEYVTLEGVAAIRQHFKDQFSTLPVDLQYALANAQKIYAGLRVVWYTGDGSTRSRLSRTFSQELDGLGLPDPDGGSSPGESAWSDSGGKSRGDFAAEMVVGLAGSSYKSAW